MSDVIVIGSGLGGLECAYILARHGMKVTVLEQDSSIGGCLGTFRRGETVFDTGFHYVGGLGEGEPLYSLFKYFDLLDLPWQQLDTECFDEVVIGDEAFPLANGHRRFAERLSEHFPSERESIEKYACFLKDVGEHIFDVFRQGSSGPSPLFARSAYEYLNSTVKDPLLRKVLSGTSLKMELRADTLPLYVFAQINNSFIQSAWRLRGGGSQIADRLADNIRAMGGEIRTRAAVTSMKGSNGRISEVTVNNEESLSADWIISGAHPAFIISLIEDNVCLRNIYRDRISSLQNTYGMFTANIRLKKGMMPYRNSNMYVHRPDTDLWRADPSSVGSVMVSWAVPPDGSDTAESIDILAPMEWNEVKGWADRPRGRRGADYVSFTSDRTEACLETVGRRLPGLRDAIDGIFTSSPLSYSSHTSSVEGSAYGIRKDCNNVMTTVLAPRTPVPNLLLTGQSLNLHGILGVSVTSFLTCMEILGPGIAGPVLDNYNDCRRSITKMNRIL